MTPAEVAAMLIELVIKLVGAEAAKQQLDKAAIARANAVADTVEEARGLK